MASLVHSAHPPRLYLLTPSVSDSTAISDDLAAALAAADVAAVLLRFAPGTERTLINRAKALAPIVQSHGAALLLDSHSEVVAPVNADGAHLTGVAELQKAIRLLKPDRIAGAGGLQTRHDAMLAGEVGADYVMFGEPGRQGRDPPFQAVVEWVAWWAELFEIPCVAYAESFDEMGQLRAAGADFIAIGKAVFGDTRGWAAAMRDAATRLRTPA